MFLAERFWPEQKNNNNNKYRRKKKERKSIKSFSTNTQAITKRATHMCDKRAYCKEKKRIEVLCTFL